MRDALRRFLFSMFLLLSDLAQAQIAAPEPERNFFARVVEDHTLLAVAVVIILLLTVGAVAFHFGRNKSE